MKAELLIDCRNQLGEGVQWREDQQRLWWTDIHGKTLWSCDEDGGAVETIPCPERLGSFTFDPQGRILASFESGLFRWDLERSRCERLTHFEPDHRTSRLNDGRCDRQGRFVAGGIDEDGHKKTSSLIRYEGGDEAETLETGIGVSNSICFSPDGRWMYFADTPSRIIRRYAYDPETGARGPAEIFLDCPKEGGFPDGACIDAEGALWSARFWGARVQRVMPDGREAERVDLDAPQVTCCCFGGRRLDRLYITTGNENLNNELAAKAPRSGGLFVAEPRVKGLPETRFARSLFAD